MCLQNDWLNSFMKYLLITILQWEAKRLIQRFQPHIIAVTGSVGKTSTKNAIAIALSTKYEVRTAQKNYNNEIGLPLAVLGEKSPGKNLFGWLALLWRGFFVKSCPAYLVLEYGADKPGDIQALTDVVQPETAVITAISPVHVANYPHLEALVHEKASLGQAVPAGGTVILSADDARVRGMRTLFHDRSIVDCGVSGGLVTVRDVHVSTRLDEAFEAGEIFAITTATVVTPDGEAELALNNAIGSSPLRACLAAVAVARAYGVPLADAVEALSEQVVPDRGRLRPMAGNKGSLILDDTYNAAPASVMAALEAVTLFDRSDKNRYVVVLGKMAELGSLSVDEHRRVGARVAEVADIFIAVNEEMKSAAQAAQEAGMKPEQIHWFATAAEASSFVDQFLAPGDVVLVKGSQSARMEKVVKAIMAEPARAEELLVRQERKWLRT